MSTNGLQNTELEHLAPLLTGNTYTSKWRGNKLIQKLDYHGITLLASEQKTLPDNLISYSRQLKAMMIANEALKQNELATLFEAFDTAGLDSLLFKGTALAYSAYPQPWLRPRSDNDILITPNDLAKFDAVFKQLGYQKLFAIQGKYVSYQATYGKALLGDSVINIDLHWHINNRQMFSKTFSIKELIENGQRLSSFGKTILKKPINIPSVIDSLLIACVHRAGHHNKEERLAWLYDIHLLANSLSSQQWQQLSDRAIVKRIASITLDALTVAHEYLNTELDEASLAKLITGTSTHEPSAIFLNRSLSERHYFWSDIKSMPTLAAKLGFIRESIFPSPAYVRQQMNTRWASVAYLKRFFRGLKRII